MEGKFSLKYLFFGKGKEAWWKTLGYGWRLLIVIFIIFVIYRAFFQKTTSVHVGSGGTAIINQAPKKRFMIPFIEVYVSQESNNKMNTGIRGGLRFEW